MTGNAGGPRVLHFFRCIDAVQHGQLMRLRMAQDAGNLAPVGHEKVARAGFQKDG